MAYLLDADVFIGAKNFHYGFDFCPAFWDWLIFRQRAGVVFSVEKVGDELLAVEGRLSDWVRERGSSFFRSPMEADLPSTNPEFEPIVLTDVDEDAVQVVAELLEVIGA